MIWMQRKQELTRLRKLGRLHFLRKVTLAVVLVSLFIIASSIGETRTQFSDTETSAGNSISVATFESTLELSCGSSKKTYWDKPGPFDPIASKDTSGDLVLDFGVITPENANNSPDVFRIKNISNQSVEVSFELLDGLGPLFSSVALLDAADGGTLLPGQTSRVRMKFPPHSKPVGEHHGNLKISACNGLLSRNIPLKITIAKPPQ